MFLSFSSSSSSPSSASTSYGDLLHHHHALSSIPCNDAIGGGLLPLPPSCFSGHYPHHYIPDSANLPLPPLIPPYSSPPSSSSCDYLDFNASSAGGPVRRVLSTGDLQATNGVQENYGQEGGAAAAGKVGRYSAEERKERIERYRSKRNQRNFHKKITYACRKTLADSRPRVRGRFARNGGDAEAEAEAAAAAAAATCFDGGYYDQSQSYGVGGDEWWSQLQAALAADVEDEASLLYDEDAALLASFPGDAFSMNILS